MRCPACSGCRLLRSTVDGDPSFFGFTGKTEHMTRCEAGTDCVLSMDVRGQALTNGHCPDMSHAFGRRRLGPNCAALSACGVRIHGWRSGGQLNHKSRAARLLPFAAYLAPMGLHNFLRNGQAQAIAMALGREEWLE